jgi:glycosyltransferase involved in cell wall biosynthesis
MKEYPSSISVVIPTFNNSGSILWTMDGIKRQIINQNSIEVIVVDDGSTNSNISFLREKSYPFPIQIIRHVKNQGRAAARNTGIKASRYPYILFIDDDIELNQGALNAHIKALKGEDKPIVNIGRVVWGNRYKLTTVMSYLEEKGAFYGIAQNTHKEILYLSSGNLFCKKKDIIKVGCFDESFSRYGLEDIDLGIRLKCTFKRKFSYAPKAMALHQRTYDIDSFIKRQIDEGYSRAFLCDKYCYNWLDLINFDDIFDCYLKHTKKNIEQMIDKAKRHEKDFSSNSRSKLFALLDILGRYCSAKGCLEFLTEQKGVKVSEFVKNTEGDHLIFPLVYQRAKYYNKYREFSKVDSLWKRYSDLNTRNRSFLFFLGKNAFCDEKYEEAIKYMNNFEKDAISERMLLEARYVKASAFERKGDFNKAIEEFNTLKCFPKILLNNYINGISYHLKNMKKTKEIKRPIDD